MAAASNGVKAVYLKEFTCPLPTENGNKRLAPTASTAVSVVAKKSLNVKEAEAKNADMATKKAVPNPSPVYRPKELDSFYEKIRSMQWRFLRKDAMVLHTHILVNWQSWASQAKKDHLFIRSASNLPRSLLWTTDNQIFILFNKRVKLEGQNTHDRLIGQGAYKTVKFALNYLSGEWLASSSMMNTKDNWFIGNKDLKGFELVRGLPGFIQMRYFFKYKGKTGKDKLRFLTTPYPYNLGEVIKEYSSNTSFKSVLNKIIQSLLQSFIAFQKRNLLHRDLKPENILVDYVGNVCVCDLSLVCKADDAKKGDAATTIWSAPPEYAVAWQKRHEIYMKHKDQILAIEARSEHGVVAEEDKKAYANIITQMEQPMHDVTTLDLDMWSMGCILYSIVFGRPYWTLETDDVPYFKSFVKLTKSVETLIAKPKDTQSIEYLISWMLRLKPAERIKVNDLETFVKNGIKF